MGIKKIKKENDELSISIIDSLSQFDTSPTKKYTQFLVKMLNLRLNDYSSLVQDAIIPEYSKIDMVLPLLNKKNILIRTLFTDYFGHRNLGDFIEFCELMDRGLVDENDISKYDSWDMLKEEMYKAKNKKYLKNAKKEIKVVYEDDEYLMLKPLTHASSCVYGYNAKWCTSMVNEKEYFYSHSRDGILIYVLNKKTNKKFGFYNKYDKKYDDTQRSFKIFNQEDKEIDSIQTGIPFNLLNFLVMELDTENPNNMPNYKYFSEDEINETKKYTPIYNLNHEIEHNRFLIPELVDDTQPILDLQTRIEDDWSRLTHRRRFESVRNRTTNEVIQITYPTDDLP
jgi:hypothetical protein